MYDVIRDRRDGLAVDFFFYFNPFLINILIVTATKKKLHKVALLVASALQA